MPKGISVPVTQSGLETSINQAVKNVGPINIPANIDPSAFKNLAQPLGRVSGLATEFEKSIAASNARVLAFGASVGIINGVQNSFAELVKTGIEVQKTLADIAAISGQGGKELSKFGDELFNIGKLTGQTFKTASQAALEFSRQGLGVQETLKRTSDALTLTRFTTLSASEAVDVLTAAANSFGETGITTAQIINKLVAVDTKFAVSAEDLANGLARAGSIAQEVGVSFDELNAAITVAQERTARGGAVIGNALKTIFTRLRSDETVKALRSIGVESLNAQGGLKGAVPILEEVSNKIKTLSESDRIQILESVASKYNINILSAILNDLNDANSKFGQAVAVSAGANTQAYERQIELNKALAAELNRASVSATQLFNKLSEIGVTDSLANLLKFVNNLLEGFNKILDSEGIGGNIAKGLIKGISDVFFTIGLPIIGAIFIKLTKDIAQFGVESLKTILGINQQVKERQALEQAVVNTLIKDQEIMATILALSGNRAKQEEYLLGVYNRQLAALQQVQSIATGITPALMAGGLTATSGQIRKRAAGGYLPSKEASDVRRGVGGASASSKVVSIPNFAFGGGKRGTMIANTSEYIVPNFANGGSAIFNQDMVKSYGLPAGAKKISAAGGYVPNFARYVYDADRIESDKNSLLKAILTSQVKKNLLVGPAGSGKSTYGSSLGSFITNASQLADATEIDILSGAARTKDGGISKNFQQIADAVNASGGKISYLYTGNMDILSRRTGRIGTGPQEGDLRSKKQIAGSMYAPLNQFDFISQVKNKAKNFEMIRGAKGYIPNFADAEGFNIAYVYNPNSGQKPYVGAADKLVYDESRPVTKNNTYRSPKFQALINAGVYTKITDPKELARIKNQKETELSQRRQASSFGPGKSAAMLVPDSNYEPSFAEPKSPENQIYSLVRFPIYGVNEERLNNIPNKVSTAKRRVPEFKKTLKDVVDNLGINFASTLTGSEVSENVYSQAFTKSYGAKQALDGLAGGLFEASVRSLTFPESIREKNENSLDFPNLSSEAGQILKHVFNIGAESSADLKGSKSDSIKKKFASQVISNGLFSEIKTAARGYVPNFAKEDPLTDAVNRELAAGLNPNQIRITQDGKLKNSKNPYGLAVINTRDEPNGKIPNFAKNEDKIRKQTLGSGIAQGPLLPKGQVPIPQSAEEASKALGRVSKAAEEVSSSNDKFSANILKTSAIFGALSSASYMLEGSLKETDNALLKYTKGLTDTAQKASLGLTLGEGFKPILDSLGGKLPGAVGAFTKSLAGATPVIGSVIGGMLGLADFLEFITTQDKRAGEASGKKFTEGLSGLSEADQKKQIESRLAALSKAEDQANKILEPARENRAAFRASGMMGAGLGFAATTETPKTEEGKKAQTDLQKIAGEREALQERLKSLIDSIAKGRERETKAQAETVAQINRRVNLQSVLNEIIIAGLRSEDKFLRQQITQRGQLIAQSAMLTKDEQERRQYNIERGSIQKKINNLEQENLVYVLSQVNSKSATASLDEKAAKSLIDRLKNAETIADFEQEAAKLGLETGGILKDIFDTAKKTKKEKEVQLKRSQAELRVNYEAKKTNDLMTATFEAQLSILDDRRKTTQEIADIEKASRRDQEKFERNRPLKTLEQNIATQPFATVKQEAQLAKLNAETKYKNELADIETEKEDKKTNAFKKVQSSLRDYVSNSRSFTDAQRISALYSIDNAENTEQLKSALGDLKPETDAQTISTAKLSEALNNLDKVYQSTTTAADAFASRRRGELQDPKDTAQFLQDTLKEQNPLKYGLMQGFQDISKESDAFAINFGKTTTLAFRDGMRDALSAAISQTEDLGTALQSVAMNFLKTMQTQFLQSAANNAILGLQGAFPSVFNGTFGAVKNSKGGLIRAYAGGGFVTDGSGYRDDVPAMLMNGEYVIRKSAVKKYGKDMFDKMNSGMEIGMADGGIFLPGVRGGSAIGGYRDLTAFANQTTTSGITDILAGTAGSAFINLEDQSQRLSRFGLLNEDTINQEIKSAQEQALNIVKEREAYRTQQRKALQQQVVGTILSAAISYGSSKLVPPGPNTRVGMERAGAPPALALRSGLGNAYGGLIRRYASGGTVDDIPALLMGGEYVLNKETTRKYGKQFLDSINRGSAPRFADGGMVSGESMADKVDKISNKLESGASSANVSININVAQNGMAQTSVEGNSKQDGVDYKRLGDQVRALVVEEIASQKRVGGMLRT